jgi:hypothetical protein
MQIVIAALLSTLFFSNTAVAANEFYYSDLTDPPRQLIINDRGISFGGVLSPAESCSAKSDYACFSGAGFKFAVPKTVDSKSSWEFDGIAYELKRRERFPMLGQAVEVLFIEQIQGKQVFKFLFSEERGLIGFSTAGEVHRFFLLEGRCGFGAKPSCRN